LGPLAVHPQSFFLWLLQTSWQATVLVCLILLVQKVLGQRIGVRGRYWLWIVLLIRLAMPWAPQSPVSMYNLLPLPLSEGYGWAATPKTGSAGPGLAAFDDALATDRYGKARPTANDAREAAAATSLGSRVHHWLTEHGTVLFLFWLAGACTLAGYIVVGHVRLWYIVRREPPVTDRQVLDLLEDCRRQMRSRVAVRLIATDMIGSPALFGCLWPRLLLPRQTLSELSLQELRHIFLHELAHLKRHDILIGCLATLFHVLHWFNPLIALGFKRMRSDREMACDGLALSVLAPDETTAYGLTIVHQIEQLLTSRPRWMLATLSGDRARVKQRIARISKFRKETFRRSPVAIGLVGLLACVGLTDGLAPRASWDDYARSDLPTTHQDKHANIQRACIRNRLTGKYLVVDGERVTCDADEPGEAGLWEFRFDKASNALEDTVYFYSVAACKYLTSDEQGTLAVDALEPNDSAQWSVADRPGGNLIISRTFENGYLLPDEEGHIRAVKFCKNALSYWDIHRVWRIKTSDDPASNPQWQREKIPGLD
jgi:beta-lactamase regulating signal transducer with metallopeptidase domain